MVGVLPFDRGQVLEARVEPSGVVSVDPREDLPSHSGAVFEPVPADEFTFQRTEERFSDCDFRGSLQHLGEFL